MSQTAFGAPLELAKEYAFLSLGQFTANTTVTPAPRFGVPVGTGKVRVLGLHVVGSAVPSDPDGTMLLNVLAKDVSESADDTLVSSADLETLITAADRVFELTLASESSENELTLEEGDTLRVTLVNNSAAITTNPNVTLIVEYVRLPMLPSEIEDSPKYLGRESQY